MGFLNVLQALILSLALILVSVLLRVFWSCWVLPKKAYGRLRKNGFGGPTPNFPLGNISDVIQITKKKAMDSSSPPSEITHDIHSIVFPYFAEWQKSHGKVFIYWLGTEPFLYIADPEFLKQMSAGVMGKCWGKPTVFKNDREPMFGNGLLMVEGDEWVRHRHVITPAFSPSNLKAMVSLMVESTASMLDRWAGLISTGHREIDVEREVTSTAGEIIAKTSFGISNEKGRRVVEKLRAMQVILFKSNRFVGVPFSKVMCPKQTLEARRLCREIDVLVESIIAARRNSPVGCGDQKDLLGLLLADRGGDRLTTRELVDECKTFFFAGHETTALALTWTLLCLAMYPEWQDQLRDEIKEVIGEGSIDASTLTGLKKMGWVMNEVFRLYPPAPNQQRQAREDIRVGDVVIPSGTNMWIDVVAMHHDPALWGTTAYEFRPERFAGDAHGGCSHKMGFLPFGFGGRMCVGRNMSMMEYKVVLTLMLTRFSFSLSPGYRHSPAIVLSLRPMHGLPLIVTPL
ncbi:hypothetical protein NMG60_11018109 [Bertholletia excelsa]